MAGHKVTVGSEEESRVLADAEKARALAILFCLILFVSLFAALFT